MSLFGGTRTLNSKFVSTLVFVSALVVNSTSSSPTNLAAQVGWISKTAWMPLSINVERFMR